MLSSRTFQTILVMLAILPTIPDVSDNAISYYILALKTCTKPKHKQTVLV